MIKKSKGNNMSELKTIDETTIINIIVSAGTANGKLQQAFGEMMSGKESGSQELLEQANEELRKAHDAQTELLSDEADGENALVTLLMVHAQDHLMNAILCKQLMSNMIEMQKQINELKSK